MSALEDTTASLLPDWPPLDPAQRTAVTARCASFVRQQLHLAPHHVRVGVRTLFAVYRCFALLRHGFHPSTSARAESLAAFSALPFPMFFGLERVLRSMSLLCYFEQPEVLTALGEQTIVERQLEFRRRRGMAPTARAPSTRNVTPIETMPLIATKD